MNLKLTTSAMLILLGCSHAPSEGDRRLNKKEIPDFLKSYEQHRSVEFYEKSRRKGNKSFEVKYIENSKEVSLAFDLKGKLLEEERDIDLEDLSPKVRKKIQSYIEEKYPGAKILELERRVEHGKDHYIDVEIRSATSNSGYWELSFTVDGEYSYREEENYHPVETLN